jgi:uncharacterized protein YdaT
MPWTSNDADKHKKGLSSGQKKRWAKIANSVLKGCMKDTGDTGKCEASAIKIANAKCMETKRMA